MRIPIPEIHEWTSVFHGKAGLHKKKEQKLEIFSLPGCQRDMWTIGRNIDSIVHLYVAYYRVCCALITIVFVP